MGSRRSGGAPACRRRRSHERQPGAHAMTCPSSRAQGSIRVCAWPQSNAQASRKPDTSARGRGKHPCARGRPCMAAMHATAERRKESLSLSLARTPARTPEHNSANTQHTAHVPGGGPCVQRRACGRSWANGAHRRSLPENATSTRGVKVGGI
jgi:hypothetical protein